MFWFINEYCVLCGPLVILSTFMNTNIGNISLWVIGGRESTKITLVALLATLEYLIWRFHFIADYVFFFTYVILSCAWKHHLLFHLSILVLALYLNLIPDPLFLLNIFFYCWLIATQQLATLSLCCSFRKRKVISNPRELGLDSLFYFSLYAGN